MEFENTVVIELTSDKAMERLLELEVLNFTKVIKEKTEPEKQKLSENFRGILTKDQGISLDSHIKQIRSEWDRI